MGGVDTQSGTWTHRCRRQVAAEGQAGCQAGWAVQCGCAGGWCCSQGRPLGGHSQPADEAVVTSRWLALARPQPPTLPRAHQASVPTTQRQGACEARGQRPRARQQPVHVAGCAHGVAAKHVDGLVQVVFHLALWGTGWA